MAASLHRSRFLNVLSMLLVFASNTLGAVNVACCCQRAALLGSQCDTVDDAPGNVGECCGGGCCSGDSHAVSQDPSSTGDCCSSTMADGPSSESQAAQQCAHCDQCGKQARRPKAALQPAGRQAFDSAALISRAAQVEPAILVPNKRDHVVWSTHNQHRAWLGVWLN